MEKFPRGFILGRNYGNISRAFRLNAKDENGDVYQAVLKLENGILKLANNLKHADNLTFIVKKLYAHKALDFALYDMNYKMHFLSKEKKYCRLDLEYASFLGSIGEVVGLYVDTDRVNSLLLFMPKGLKFSEIQLKNLELFKDMIEEVDMVETMLCDKDYKNNEHMSKQETILLLNNILDFDESNTIKK